MHVFALGASRHIGYHASIRFLSKGDTVSIVIRNPSTLENDPALSEYIKSGKARLIKSDATNEQSLTTAWTEASKESPIDLILYTVGGSGKLHPLKGVVMIPHDLCTQGVLNILSVVHKTNSPTPRLVILSTTGITQNAMRVLPLPLKPIYWYLLRPAFMDKRGAEAILFHSIGQPYETKRDGTSEAPGPEYLKEGWKNTFPEGMLKDSGAVVIRAAQLTDGESRGVYRAAKGDFGTYNVSRQDVAHFIVEDLTKNWDKYASGVVTVGY